MTPQQALARLQNMCSRTEYCRGQIRMRLNKWSKANVSAGSPGFTPGQMLEIENFLLEEGYVDDWRFANAYVRDKARFMKWGSVKIVSNLRALGIDNCIIERAVAMNSDLFGIEVVEELLTRKWNLLKKDEPLEKKRQKVIRFGIGRGFGYEQIIKVVKNLS